MKNQKLFWTTIALFNFCVVVSLGFLLRSKIVFPIPGLDFKNVLDAHWHFAFSGWVTLAILSLMVYELLPVERSTRPIYSWIFAAIFLNSIGMLVAFLLQDYAFYSLLFSILFIVTTYVFCFVFLKDLAKTKPAKAIGIICAASLVSLVSSSIGQIIVVFMLITKSVDLLLFRDAIYTYLHFQYNGFFALGVFSLFINLIHKDLNEKGARASLYFAIAISISILPSLFISYLWHVQNVFIHFIALGSCVLLIWVLIALFVFLRDIKGQIKNLNSFARTIGLLAIIAFGLKTILQMGTVIPWLGKLVFGDRAVIIGYLHLVLLGFTTLYLLAHLLQTNILNTQNSLTKKGILVFATGVIINEVILMTQGLGNMLWFSSKVYAWLLWVVSIWLFLGAIFIFISKMKQIQKTSN